VEITRRFGRRKAARIVAKEDSQKNGNEI